MIVLDYPKTTKDLSIVVPPFHTGHLGFIPGTEVFVGIMAPNPSGRPSHCEVVISPFPHDTRQMARISCTMRDDIGVVGKLVNAISQYQVNIASQESSSINHLKHHTVNLLVDLSTSTLEERKTKESIIRLYSRFDNLLPLHDFRYILLFESIMAHCADVIVWEDMLGRHLPRLTLQPLSSLKLDRKQQTATVEKAEQEPHHLPYHVRIKLPDHISSTIRKTMRLPTDKPVHYILLSDTDERNLRVFFPTPEVRESLIHLGFYHDDMPGALSTIMQAVAASQFNILTSLLRKEKTETNIWETILQYKGAERMPNSSQSEEVCAWMAGLMRSNSNNLQRMAESNVKVGAPLYPRIRGSWDDTIKVALDEINYADIATEDPSQEDLLSQRMTAVEKIPAGSIEASRTLDVLSLVIKRVKKGDRSTIFLSYPHHAKLHAELIKESLETNYNVSSYQQPDGEIILTEVLSKILDSDYFIGIWHHDEQMPVGNGKYSISPWMPFEYGIAFSAGKQAIVIHSEKLDEKFWNRINPGVTNPDYSDLDFRDKTVKLIKTYCLKNFK